MDVQSCLWSMLDSPADKAFSVGSMTEIETLEDQLTNPVSDASMSKTRLGRSTESAALRRPMALDQS